MNDRKKKNFSFTRRFPFMKSKDHSGSEEVSCDERTYIVDYRTLFTAICAIKRVILLRGLSG